MRGETDPVGLNFVVCYDGSGAALRGLTIAKELLRRPTDKLSVLAVIEKEDNKDALTEKVQAELSRLNLKAEVQLREREAEETVGERILKEVGQAEGPACHFLVAGRSGSGERAEMGFAVGKTAEFLAKRWEGNSVFH